MNITLNQGNNLPTVVDKISILKSQTNVEVKYMQPPEVGYITLKGFVPGILTASQSQILQMFLVYLRLYLVVGTMDGDTGNYCL